MSDVSVRLATTPADVEAVQRLRYVAYVREMRLFTGRADHEHELLADEHDAVADLLLATADGEPAGTMRLVHGAALLGDELADNYDIQRWCPHPLSCEQVMVCSKFAVLSAHRTSPVAWELIRATVRAALEYGSEVVLCDCQPHLVSLYTSLGFRPYRASFLDPDIGLTVPLVLVVRDTEFLRSVRSPLLDAGLGGVAPTPATRQALRKLGHCDTVRGSDSLQLERVRELAAFDGLSYRDLTAVTSRAQVLSLRRGDRLVQQGQLTHTMYIVLDGALAAGRPDRPERAFAAGDTIGEIAFLLRRERTTDVHVTSDTAQVLALSERTLSRLVADYGPAAARLLHNLARTLAGRLAEEIAAHRAVTSAPPGAGGP